ncbi:MAG: metallophosphoesterase [Bacillota bacterium]
MKFGVWFVFALFFGLYGLLNYYIGLRGWQYIFKNISGLSATVYWVIFWLIAWAYIIEFAGKRIFPNEINVALTWLGSYWLGIMFYALLILGLIDAIRMISGLSGLFPGLQAFFAEHRSIIPAGVVMIITVLLIFGSWNALNPQVTKYALTIPKSGGGLSQIKMVLVSDIHLGKIVGLNRLNKMVEMVNQTQPDVVVFAGDMIDGNVDIFTEQRLDNALKNIKAKYGVYAVLGNHEYISREVDRAIFYLDKGGVNVLKDEVVRVANSFYLIGRDERSNHNFSGAGRRVLSDLLKGVNKNDPLILLDHQPQNLAEAEEAGIDLQLSGHTHKGQFFPINLITQRIFENDWGYLAKGSLQVIVSNGFGTWGPPIRIGNIPEIVEIIIRFQPRESN